jgi:hypothetical protein
MRYLSLGLAIVFLIVVSGICVFAAEKETKTTTPVEKTAAKEEVKAVKKETKIEQKESEKAESLFKKANESFIKKDTKAAAADIRTASALLKAESALAATETKEAITKSAQELETLAADVEKGIVTSGKKLEDSFAKASYSIANLHFVKSKEASGKKDMKTAGTELKEAIKFVQEGYKWTGTKAEEGGAAVLKNSGDVAQKMSRGLKVAAGESQRAIINVGKEIEKVGKKIMPAKETPEVEKKTEPAKKMEAEKKPGNK